MSEDFPALAGFRVGSLLGGYRLESQVGVGGMAVVFRARDERLGRLVALKILTEGALPPRRAAEFLSPVASALDAAHGVGLVHRDVKPANVLVDARPDRPDHVYLSDFGVSKGAVSSVSLTATGWFLGTPDYSAPEQIEGRAVDGRTDQYALACVAYQLLTGEVPFERDQGMAVLLAHLSAPPPSLSSRRPGLPGAADEVLARGMAKVPEKRYGSCRDFADALREALSLAPYHLRGPASAPDYPQTQTVSPPPEFPATAETPTTTQQDPVSPIPVMTAPPAAPRAPALSRTGHAVRHRWVIIATGAAIAAVIGVIAATLLLPGKPVTGSQTLDVAVVGPLAAVGGMPLQVLQDNTTLTHVVSGTLSPNAAGTELEWNSKVSPGTYQVCVEPPGNLKFTGTNMHVLQGWACSPASVAGGPTSVVFRIAV